MTQFTATWTNTVKEDFEAGDFLRFDKFRDYIGQNIEHLGQNHQHDGSAGSGGILATADPKYIWFVAAAAGGPFA